MLHVRLPRGLIAKLLEAFCQGESVKTHHAIQEFVDDVWKLTGPRKGRNLDHCRADHQKPQWAEKWVSRSL